MSKKMRLGDSEVPNIKLEKVTTSDYILTIDTPERSSLDLPPWCIPGAEVILTDNRTCRVDAINETDVSVTIKKTTEVLSVPPSQLKRLVPKQSDKVLVVDDFDVYDAELLSIEGSDGIIKFDNGHYKIMDINKIAKLAIDGYDHVSSLYPPGSRLDLPKWCTPGAEVILTGNRTCRVDAINNTDVTVSIKNTFPTQVLKVPPSQLKRLVPEQQDRVRVVDDFDVYDAELLSIEDSNGIIKLDNGNYKILDINAIAKLAIDGYGHL